MSGLRSLFGVASQPTATQPTAIQGINVQTSVLGKGVPIVYGTVRVPGNLILYGNVRTVTVNTTSGGGGGKGGVFGGGTASTTTTYNYFADFAFALCEGPIIGISKCWQAKNIVTLSLLGF